jgi:hypothetical protein
VGPRAVLDAVVKRKIPSLRRESNPRTPIIQATATNKYSIHEESKSRLNSRNACYHSGQSLLSSYLMPKYLQIKVYENILGFVLYGYETWSLTLPVKQIEGV